MSKASVVGSAVPAELEASSKATDPTSRVPRCCGAPGTCKRRMCCGCGMLSLTFFLVVLSYVLYYWYGRNNCGFFKEFADLKVLCVEVPPKVVAGDGRARRLRRGLQVAGEVHDTSAEEKSMSFHCNSAEVPEEPGRVVRGALSAEELARCKQYCHADYIFVKQVFFVQDEIDGRAHWAGDAIGKTMVGTGLGEGGHIITVRNEEPLSFHFDYAYGCKGGKAEYLQQDFQDAETFQCGYSEIGYDLYHKVPGECDSGEQRDMNGDNYCYARMSNLIFATDLQGLIRDVDSGAKEPGTYTYPYPKDYDGIVPGCVATHKVDFRMPAAVTVTAQAN